MRTVQNVAVPARPNGRRGYAARAVGAFIPQLTRKAFEKHGFSTVALITDWSAIVGRDVAGYSVPSRLKWPRALGGGTQGADDAAAAAGEVAADRGRGGATLIVAVDPARALDIEYRAGQLIEAINAFFGYRAVASLKVVQSPATFAAVPRSLTQASIRRAAPIPKGAGEEPLRGALARLAAEVHNRGVA